MEALKDKSLNQMKRWRAKAEQLNLQLHLGTSEAKEDNIVWQSDVIDWQYATGASEVAQMFVGVVVKLRQ